MSNERYNGWANYETWNINLWLANDECLYTGILELTNGKKIKTIKDTKEKVSALFGEKTPDGVSLKDKKIKWSEIKEAINEF